LLQPYSPEIIIILTKVDLLDKNEIAKMTDFIQSALVKEFQRSFKLFLYSTRQNTETFKNRIEAEIFFPLLKEFDREHAKILHHKIESLAQSALAFLEIAYQASLKTEAERENLKKKIFEEQLSLEFLKIQLQLLLSRLKNQTREKNSTRLLAYQNELEQKVTGAFQKDFPNWDGHLYRLARTFERWLKEILTENFRTILQKESEYAYEILNHAQKGFSFFTKSFRERLNHQLQSVMNIRLPEENWIIEIDTIESPDITVAWAFDIQLDLLWFLFPMAIFRNIFYRFFLKKIPYEVEKNIRRIVSALTETTNVETEHLYFRALSYIRDELSTIGSLLQGRDYESAKIDQAMQQIKDRISSTANSRESVTMSELNSKSKRK
jgi:hypothetical protein